MADDNAKELCRREEKQFGAKANLDSLNQELALNFYPERADFTTERALGEEFAVDLMDSEPMRCRRDLGDARASMLRPSGEEWCKAKSRKKELNEKPHIAQFFDWFNEITRARMYEADTGFVRASKEADHDLVTFGNSIQTVEAELGRDANKEALIRSWHPRDCAWLDDANGVRQDLMFRRFKASARHIKQKFPNATLAEPIKKALEKDGNKDQEFKLCHAMMRADEYDFYKKPRRKTQWVSVYYDSEHKMLLAERPSDRFRYVVDRWRTLQGSQYGYSPASMTALPDARGIQTMAMVLLEAGEKSLDPPLVAIQKNIKSDINQSAGRVTFIDGDYDERTGASVGPMFPDGFKPQLGIDLINRTTYQLRDLWYLTKLSLPPQSGRTAYETSELVKEFIRANTPLFESWLAGVEMVVDEIIQVLIEIGAYGSLLDWPKELSGGKLAYDLANPLRDAIELNKVNQANIILGAAAGISKVNPQAPGARRIDLDKLMEGVAQGSQSPADWLKDEDQAAAEAQATSQEGDIVKALQGAGMAADVVNGGLDAAGKLRELATPVDGSAPFGPT
jgi:Bacteriophage head to tail connecting protein